MTSKLTRILSMLTLFVVAGNESPGFADRPNIIVIMADDMGYADTGFTGATDIQTPNLNKLAASGVTFSSGYVTHPYCGPSRAGLLSGRYQHRFGFETNPAYDPSNPYMGIDADEELFPKRLQKAGYRTGVIGKWHLGAAAPFHPNKRGFDYFYGFLGGGHDYFRIDLRQPVKEGYLQALERNGKPAVFDGYLTTALSMDAAEFVKSSKDQPFFLYLAYNAPHAPLQAPKEALDRYSYINDSKRQAYAAMVDMMDAGIGKVIDALEETGVRDNTLVFFLSDNGGPQASLQQPGKWNGSSNTPFRGGKGNLYDGGVHVPFIASWPDRLPAGTVYENPVISLDIAATAVSCAGVHAEAKGGLEGVDLIPALTGEQETSPHDFLYWRDGGGAKWSILSSDRVKHVQDNPGRRPELFRLVNDVSEEKDLSDELPTLVTSLREHWASWNQSNVESRLDNYKSYHADRDQFFLDSIPEKATGGGYQPQPIPTFK
jgi:arylsulfatase A-like enzyme